MLLIIISPFRLRFRSHVTTNSRECNSSSFIHLSLTVYNLSIWQCPLIAHLKSMRLPLNVGMLKYTVYGMKFIKNDGNMSFGSNVGRKEAGAWTRRHQKCRYKIRKLT